MSYKLLHVVRQNAFLLNRASFCRQNKEWPDGLYTWSPQWVLLRAGWVTKVGGTSLEGHFKVQPVPRAFLARSFTSFLRTLNSWESSGSLGAVVSPESSHAQEKMYAMCHLNDNRFPPFSYLQTVANLSGNTSVYVMASIGYYGNTISKKFLLLQYRFLCILRSIEVPWVILSANGWSAIPLHENQGRDLLIRKIIGTWEMISCFV